MTYFKVIKNDKVIDVGCVFLKWNTKRHKYNVCSVDEGQFLQSLDEQHIYRDTWMKSYPKEASGYSFADISAITESEFDDLRELLSEGEEITIEEAPNEIFEVHEAEEHEDKPMSIADMRKIIAEQQMQIELLNQRLNM